MGFSVSYDPPISWSPSVPRSTHFPANMGTQSIETAKSAPPLVHQVRWPFRMSLPLEMVQTTGPVAAKGFHRSHSSPGTFRASLFNAVSFSLHIHGEHSGKFKFQRTARSR